MHHERHSYLLGRLLAACLLLLPATAFAAHGGGALCDITVYGGSIQAAVDGAAEGDVVCVAPGTHAEDVMLDKEITLRGTSAPRGRRAAALDGQIRVTADGAVVQWLVVAPTETFAFPDEDQAGILVHADDVHVIGNIVEGMSADSTGPDDKVTLNGIQVWNNDAGDPVSGVVVEGNLVRGFRNQGDPAESYPNWGGVAGIKIQGILDGIEVRRNTVTDLHSAGWGWGIVLTEAPTAPGVAPLDVTVEWNTIAGINDGSVQFAGMDPFFPGSAFGIDNGAEATEATFRYNNLDAPNGAETKDPDSDLTAECNYWAHALGPEDDDNPRGRGSEILERNAGEIDYTPWSLRPFRADRNPDQVCIGGEGPAVGGPGGGPMAP